MIPADNDIKNELKKNFIERLISNFLDVIILSRFCDSALNAKDVILFVQKQFGYSLSSHKVHSTLYAMERKKLIVAATTDGKIIYRLTEKGKLTVKVTTESDEIKVFMEKLMARNNGFSK